MICDTIQENSSDCPFLRGVKSMIGPYINKVKSMIQWGKIFLPLSSLRYYPPQFALRNPVLEGVKSAFVDGHEVAVVAFNIKNLQELAEQLGPVDYSRYINTMKKYFRLAVERKLPKDDVISLHDYYGYGVALIIKVDYDRHCISEIDAMMTKVILDVEQNIGIYYSPILSQIEAGYMFVEKKDHYSLEEAVGRAYRQAVAMSEKKEVSEFNELMYTMKKIISLKEIKLLAQPIIDVATNEIRAWELLTRGPKETVLENPLPLFSVARQTGTLYDLEMIVFEKAFQQIVKTGCRQDVFVNCTPLTMGNMRFIQDLRALMKRFKRISPKQITFEITERDSIEELKNFKYNIRVLRLMGFRIAVDDTGAGYSSLNTISELLPEIIKIDRSVIEDIDKNTLKESMLKGLLLVAKEAGSLVVAEGIENKEEASVLKRNKVHLAQGYFYARPSTLMKNVATY